MKLYHNAKFYALNSDNDIYQAILVENGVIRKCYKQTPHMTNIEKIDLKGSTVFPGFIDSHTHSFEGGLYSMGADLQNATSLEEVYELIDASPVLGKYKFAFGLDENRLKEKRFPTKSELDKVVPNNPLLLRRIDGHSCVVNSKALTIIDFPHKLPNNFNGLLNKENNDIAAHTFHNTLDAEAILEAYKAANDIAVRSGLTTVHTMIGDAQNSFNHFPLIQDNLSKFDINFVLYPQFFNVEKALARNSKRIGGCILADGSFGSHTAALSSPYTDDSSCLGNLYQTDEFWDDFVWEAHRNNLQVGVHCIGDSAIDQIVNAYVKAQKRDPKDLKHQIIHNELMSDETLSKMSEYNISAVMQPSFDKLWGGEEQFYAKVLGKERAMQTNRFKTILDSGVLLAGSSDWYITTLNILEQLEAAISHHNKQERLSIGEAIKIYTTNAATLENVTNKGFIAPDFKADMSILKLDPFLEKSFSNNEIVGVVISGKIFYV
ncbi:MAG: amidohydrolase [Candidatus Cloacimonadales bacterium]